MCYTVDMVKPTTPPEVVAFFRAAAAQRRRSDRPCVVCGTLMEGALLKQRYCSRHCHDQFWSRRRRNGEPTPAREAP